MRTTIVSAIAIALLILWGAASSADQVSDLKSKVQELEKKVEALEDKQKEQSDTIEYLQEQPAAGDIVSKALSEQVSIGGHLKFFLADQSIGEVNGEDQHNSFAMGFNDLWLYFNKRITDWLNLNVAPQILAVAEATPSLGSDITRSGTADIQIDLDEAFLTVRLPKRYEIKAGLFYPMFSEEYATKSWWHEQYHNNNGLVTLEAIQSFGIEIYKTYDFASFSLPVYLSVINGTDRGISQQSRFTDNNNSVSGLLHIAPEWFLFGGRLRLLGSGGYGRWDDEGDNEAYQWAGGAEYSRSSLTFSGEYLYRRRDKLPLSGGGTQDGEDKGWYVKAKYSLSSKWRFVVKYSDVQLWSISTNQLLDDQYRSISGAVGWWITESSTIIPQIEYVDAERDGSDVTLKYTRYTLGWRTTF